MTAVYKNLQSSATLKSIKLIKGKNINHLEDKNNDLTSKFRSLSLSMAWIQKFSLVIDGLKLNKNPSSHHLCTLE